jgi:hypothetical protein
MKTSKLNLLRRIRELERRIEALENPKPVASDAVDKVSDVLSANPSTMGLVFPIVSKIANVRLVRAIDLSGMLSRLIGFLPWF